MRRPTADEHAAFYSTYTQRVGNAEVWEVLAAAPDALETLLTPVGPELEGFAYAPGKWTIREVLGHVVDAERLFAFRALHIARGDESPLPGMDQTVWAAHSGAGRRALADHLQEFRELRQANIRMLASLDEVELSRSGLASGHSVSVRALVYIIAGHELHHRGVLAERYLTPERP
ncbi:MAG: DinB family protein [Planctomycetes bacterium]|nr:DinB family protein [Planctomycetota bacterium]MCB9871849.1 DinB family protein [Planctomycetota bacterium]